MFCQTFDISFVEEIFLPNNSDSIIHFEVAGFRRFYFWIKSFIHFFLIINCNRWRRHSDWSVICIVVVGNENIKSINPNMFLCVGEEHFQSWLQSSIKSLNKCTLFFSLADIYNHLKLGNRLFVDRWNYLEFFDKNLVHLTTWFNRKLRTSIGAKNVSFHILSINILSIYYLNTLGTIIISDIILFIASDVSNNVLVFNGFAQTNREKQSMTHKI